MKTKYFLEKFVYVFPVCILKLMKIEWDERKRELVLEEHNIDFARILDIFNDPFAIYTDDHEHSTNSEIRSVMIGKTAEYGLVNLVFIDIDDNTTRLITARRAEKWMVKEYEKQRKRY